MPTYTAPRTNVSTQAATRLARSTVQGFAAWLKMCAIITLAVLLFVGSYHLLNHSDAFAGFAASYAIEYNTASDHVSIVSKPHDCEWGHAPIGNKACHYEKRIEPLQPTSGQPYVFVTWEKIND